MRTLKNKAARLAALAVTAAAGTTVALAVPAAAHAATMPAASCKTYTGTTSTFSGGKPTSGTEFTKPGDTTCHDLNLSDANATDLYRGVLLHSTTNAWQACTEGWRHFTPGQARIVLCSGVLTGTRMRVESGGSVRHITILD